jgi:hypothetical protein
MALTSSLLRFRVLWQGAKEIVGAFAFTSFRSRDLMSCDSTSPD